jgi:hypothetical protein
VSVGDLREWVRLADDDLELSFARLWGLDDF